MEHEESNLFEQFHINTTTDILSLTLVGQDLVAADILILSSVSKLFNQLLFNTKFLKRVFDEIIKLNKLNSFAEQLLVVGKKKEWNYCLWKKVQGCIGMHNLETLSNIVEAGFDVNYTGMNDISPLFLCIKHHFCDGYKLLRMKQAQQPYSTFGPRTVHRAMCDVFRFNAPNFEAMEFMGHNYPLINHVYLSVAYHEYDILKEIATTQPTYFKEAISRKYNICELVILHSSVPGYSKHEEDAKTFSLVSLEIMRRNPSPRFVDFLLSNGHPITVEELDVLDYKLRKDRNDYSFHTPIRGCYVYAEHSEELDKIEEKIMQCVSPNVLSQKGKKKEETKLLYDPPQHSKPEDSPHYIPQAEDPPPQPAKNYYCRIM